MKIVSAALAAALTLGGFAFATPSLASSASETAPTNVIEIRDRGWDNDHGWRRHGGRGWDDDDDDGWRRHHRRDRHHGYYRQHRRCHTEWVFEFGPYGARWLPIQRCYRRW
jgi:hypothetical protein